MPSVEITTTVAQAGQVATVIGPYMLVGLGFVFGPRLLKMGLSIIKKR